MLVFEQQNLMIVDTPVNVQHLHYLSLSLLRVSSESISTSAPSSCLEAAALQILCSRSVIAVITAPDTASTPLLSSPTSVGGKL